MDEREGALQGVLHAHLLAHGNAPDDGASSASASTLPVLKTTVTSVSPNPNIIYVMDISFLHQSQTHFTSVCKERSHFYSTFICYRPENPFLLVMAAPIFNDVQMTLFPQPKTLARLYQECLELRKKNSAAWY